MPCACRAGSRGELPCAPVRLAPGVASAAQAPYSTGCGAGHANPHGPRGHAGLARSASRPPRRGPSHAPGH
eukprot:5098512-Alexandrium_andersonii.AAC.1